MNPGFALASLAERKWENTPLCFSGELIDNNPNLNSYATVLRLASFIISICVIHVDAQ